MKEIQAALKHLQQALEQYWCEDGLEEAAFCRRLYQTVVVACARNRPGQEPPALRAASDKAAPLTKRRIKAPLLSLNSHIWTLYFVCFSVE
jgi:hypothetical protein